ncbi:DNA internalization-related competence protein ComEC/Rec2 [Maridesulfovibrio sp. FT414]|uniref:DNA internalization-related competence protein ComEC/Rec2 n=1 Tax=Maridesulfovibrio sp. FT414 TaxID=2979469 RepID=UPI003D8093AD
MSFADSDLNSMSRLGLPGLFLWQKLVPAFVFGILSIKWFFPAFVAFSIYVFLLICFRLEKGGVVLLILLFWLGGWYGNFALPDPAGPMPEWMEKREKVLVSGQVHAVHSAPGNKLNILLQDVVCNSTQGQSVLEGYLNWTWEKPDLIPLVGQKVEFVQRVKPATGFRNSGLWDYGFYSRSKNIFYRAYTSGPLKDGELKPYEPDFLQKLRISLRTHILQNAPPTQGGAFFPALLTGDRFFLSKDTVELVRRAGVSHVLALSGLHVGFVASLGFLLAWVVGFVAPGAYLRISRLKLGVLLAAPLVLFYLWLGQFSPSLLRAGCMFGFWGLLLLVDRGHILLDGLFLAVVLILVFSPLSVFDLGFQLSVLAVAGIGLLFPFFRKLLPSGSGALSKGCSFLLAVLYVSLCANIALYPVLVWNFGTVLPNVLFNVFFVPLLGLFLVPVCGFGGLAASYFCPQVSQQLFSAGSWCLEQMLSLVRIAAENGFLPEYASYRPQWEGVLGYYLLLGGVLFLVSHQYKWVKFLVLPLVLLVGLRVYPTFEERGVRMDLLDTGQSQCVVITGPLGSRTVIDGGGSFGDFDMGRAVVGPWLCYGAFPEVDNIFLTHGDSDHAGGLAFLLEKFRVSHFYCNGDMPAGELGERFAKAFAEAGLEPEVLGQGALIFLEPGLSLEIMHPSAGFGGKKNDRSLYLKLVWNGRPLLSVAGDLDRKGIKDLLKSGLDLKSQILILPHHGSAGGYSTQLYDRVDPEIVLAACGVLNRFNFVAEKVRNEFVKREIPLDTTADSGMISISWNSNGTMRRWY